MNKYIISFFLLLPVLLTSCLKEQEDLFSESAAIRLNKSITGVDEVLTQATNGWIMEYFATRESRGYSMLLNFGANDEVLVAAKNQLFNNEYTEASSLFQVIGDNGPVLSFNTYNNVLHEFSNPEDPNGFGLGGDYEFIVMDYSDSIINLKGKKRGTEITLKKLPEGISWLNYLEDLKEMSTKLFGSEPLYFISGNKVFLAQNGASGIFELQGSADDDVATVPFIITRNGIKFQSAYTTSTDKKVQSFYLNDEESRLIAVEDVNTYFAGTEVNAYIANSNETFVIDTLRMSDHYQQPFNQMCQQMKERYAGKRNIDYIALSYATNLGQSFFFVTTPTIAKANYKIEVSANTSTDNEITITKVDNTYDNNGGLFLANIPAINDVWKALEGAYKLKTTLSKKEIMFVDKENESRFFVVVKK